NEFYIVAYIHAALEFRRTLYDFRKPEKPIGVSHGIYAEVEKRSARKLGAQKTIFLRERYWKAKRNPCA
ncbi:hypothetical protein DK853_54390, partial [Klebsiella oxytoca]